MKFCINVYVEAKTRAHVRGAPADGVHRREHAATSGVSSNTARVKWRSSTRMAYESRECLEIIERQFGKTFRAAKYAQDVS